MTTWVFIFLGASLNSSLISSVTFTRNTFLKVPEGVIRVPYPSTVLLYLPILSALPFGPVYVPRKSSEKLYLYFNVFFPCSWKLVYVIIVAGFVSLKYCPTLD